MRRDHRPYWLRQTYAAYEAWHTRHFLVPHLDDAGPGLSIAKPWHVHLFGDNITIGAHVELRATRDAPIRLTTWKNADCDGAIHLGHFSMIGAGCRVMSASRVELGPGVMLATQVVISDADWHDHYDRQSVPGRTAPVILEENAWIGEGALIGKGVRIGRNAIVGARSVVVSDVPANTVAAGNPAQVIRKLDPARPVVGRRSLYADPEKLARDMDGLYRWQMEKNSLLGWLRQRLFPDKRV